MYYIYVNIIVIDDNILTKTFIIMKKLTFIVILFLGSHGLFAQATSQLNFGGLGTGLYMSYDIPVAADITVAPLGRTDWDFNRLILGARIDYYFDRLFDLPAAWDVYLGGNGGWRIINNHDNADDFDFGAQLGARWHWNEKWALNFEFGGGTSVDGGIGVTMQL